METIENLSFDEERALYGSANLVIRNCSFTGPADGESALKEARSIRAERCLFDLRYPLWHVSGLGMEDCRLTENARAALWYSSGVEVMRSHLDGIKAFRECSEVSLENCTIKSDEFGWFCRGLSMQRCTLSGVYALMRSDDISLKDVTYRGRYGLQYITGGEFSGCDITSRDAFWHARGVTVKNSILRGEFLGWYSEGLTLINCRIISSQPLCYCRGLKMTGCEMVDCDLSFEKSDVDADISSSVESIKNPLSGRILVDSVEELIVTAPESRAEVVVRRKRS